MAKPLAIYLIGAARKIFGWSPAKRGIKDRCKVGKKFQCELCKKIVPKIQVDHISPIGKAPRDWNGWDEWYKKLFCGIDNLQGLCVECHKAKSKRERAEGAYK